MAKKPFTQEDGQRSYEEYVAHLLADPEFRAIYEEEARKKKLWLQDTEACLAAKYLREKKARS